MTKIVQKELNSKRFFYLSEQINLGSKYKKIQVYLGKNIPSNLKNKYNLLKNKEIDIVANNISNMFAVDRFSNIELLQKLEELRIEWKYKKIMMSDFQLEKFWRKFAIQFIFESNAIEGSRLSEKDVSSIIFNKYIKKSINRIEIQEVINSLKAFEYLQSADFKLNQRSIISLHKLLMKDLDVNTGYKKHEIIVNNKSTILPGKVRPNMANLLQWFNASKKNKKYPLFVFADFHQRFEKIHPFEDGNGRTGRLIFNWMLLKAGYPPILFKKKNRKAYFTALDHADEGRKMKWYWHVNKSLLKNAE